MPVLPRDNLLVGTEGCKELLHMWSLSLDFQGPDEAAVVYRVVGLPQVEGDKEEGELVDSGKLLR